MLPHERKTNSEMIYRGKIINLRRDDVVFPDGKKATREIVEHHGAVGIVPVDDEGFVYMVRQFRYPFGEELLEIPAGKLEEGEEQRQLEAAVRELREETGLTAETMDYLGVIYPSVAILTERIHLYLARGLTQGELELDEDEFLNVERIPFGELEDRIHRGEIRDGKTICALSLAKDKI